MLDAKLLAASLASREAYDRVKDHVTDKDMTPPVSFWWKLVEEWYNNDPKATAVDRELLMEQAASRLSMSKHKDALLSVIRDLPDTPSPANVVSVALDLKRFNVGMELGAAIASSDTKKIRDLYEAYGTLLTATDLNHRTEWEDAVDWADLDSVVGADKRIPLAPRRLNDRVAGGALPGHHIVVFGRPEAGKTTFAVNLSAGFLNTEQRVLYIGNEDNINVIKGRMRQRLANMTPEEVMGNTAEANRVAAAKSGDRLLMRHLHNGSAEDIVPIIEEFEPSVLIVDQIRHLRSKGDSDVKRQEKAAQDVRQLAATYGLIAVSITQAYAGDHNSKGKVFLDMDDIDGSRTGVPGTADLILGIGADQDMLLRNQRMISLPKNKLSSADDSKQPILMDIDKKRVRYT